MCHEIKAFFLNKRKHFSCQVFSSFFLIFKVCSNLLLAIVYEYGKKVHFRCRQTLKNTKQKMLLKYSLIKANLKLKSKCATKLNFFN